MSKWAYSLFGLVIGGAAWYFVPMNDWSFFRGILGDVLLFVLVIGSAFWLYLGILALTMPDHARDLRPIHWIILGSTFLIFGGLTAVGHMEILFSPPSSDSFTVGMLIAAIASLTTLGNKYNKYNSTRE